MKMKKYFLGLVCTVALMACSKDDPAPATNKVPLLTATNWKITEVLADGKVGLQSECFWSNVFEFSTAGTYNVDRQCAAIGPVESGDWSFETNQTEFTWDYETGIPKSTVFKIITLDDDVFEIEAIGGDDYIRFEAVK